jgi:hypothetical protein
MQFQLDQSRVREEMVEHIRLFVAVRRKNNVVDDVFEGLPLGLVG